MDSFQGMRVIESLYLTEAGTPYDVRRTWRERLFSCPWRPFVATRTITPQVPYKGAMRLDMDTLVMHPETLRLLKKNTSPLSAIASSPAPKETA